MEQDQKPYQVRIFLKEEFAKVAGWPELVATEMAPLADILEKHNAEIDHNQFDEFSEFVKNMLDNWDSVPANQKDFCKKLAGLTTDSLLTDEKRPWFKREFTLSMNGQTAFVGGEADALIADLQTLGDGPILTSGKAFMPGAPARDVPPVRKSFFPTRHPGT